MDPQTPVSKLTGVGEYYSRKLKRLEIKTVENLVYHFPFRYDDFSKIQEIREITPGEKLSVQGVVWQIKNIRIRSGKFITTATVADQSGTIEVIWFNQPYLTQTIKAGTPISLSGKVEVEGRKLKMLSPSYEIIRNQATTPAGVTTVAGAPLHTGRLVPIYPETEGVSSKWLRAKIARVLPKYLKTQKDFMPPQILARQKLIDLARALWQIHFPKTYEDVKAARERLSFDELFLIQYLSTKRKIEWGHTRRAPKMKINTPRIAKLVKSLPFQLTAAQKRAARQILTDLTREIPANRLLEGDVGSGKTIVAAIGAYCAVTNGFETLVAAPTEILAFQHQKTLEEVLSSFNVKVGIWTGSKKIKGDITCGTHALLSTFRAQKQVGLVIVDEQHRFGVAQRAQLFLDQSAKLTPHLLTMTATPIPRTLALTLYGDLDLSILDEMPQGRQKISTFVVPNFKRQNAYKFIEGEVLLNRQAFILTPFVEPSETMASVKAARDEFEKLKDKFTKKIKLGLLHGRLKSKEKEEIIGKFKKNQIGVLVATPVVEVGIDIPNATIMMIESAERFGLAQLHQLRGRVGRGRQKSYCFLFTDSRAENSIRRLKSMERVHVGFELSEIDLKMRGPGEVFGFKQSGFVNLKIADITDQTVVAAAQREAKKIVEKEPNLKSFPLLAEKIRAQELEYIQPN
ncbi:ATP-dependent DNA helicase RecG [Candidatus Curtissbacteria bacterium]|nr:ATP-dependent DNA helicase RecG [Candidatus Curtissbacteria bacterium]